MLLCKSSDDLIQMDIKTRSNFIGFLIEKAQIYFHDIIFGESKLESNDLQLIDVRSPQEFVGEASRAELMGHIPNAINLPRKTMVAEDHTLLPKDELLTFFADKGIGGIVNASLTGTFFREGLGTLKVRLRSFLIPMTMNLCLA